MMLFIPSAITVYFSTIIKILKPILKQCFDLRSEDAWQRYALGDNTDQKEETQVADIPKEENAAPSPEEGCVNKEN